MTRTWWWLSFADGDRPAGDQFLGVCVVRGRDMREAVSRAWKLGCNPGGQVLGIPFSGRPEIAAGKLYALADLDAAGVKWCRTPKAVA